MSNYKLPTVQAVHACTACKFTVVSTARYAAGYAVCMPCGDRIARARKRTVVPMHKSNYILVSDGDRETLKGISNKGGLYR